MRKIINGRTYNTATSKEIGSGGNGLSRRDFASYSESLYRNTKGAYFLHGEGGPMSKYAVSTGQNEWSGSEQITPLTVAEAQEWAEKHLNADDYEAEFGPQEEAAPSDLATRERVTLVIDTGTITRLREYSTKTGIPMSRMADAALEKYLNENNK